MVPLAEWVVFRHVAALSFDAWQFRFANCNVSAHQSCWRRWWWRAALDNCHRRRLVERRTVTDGRGLAFRIRRRV